MEKGEVGWGRWWELEGEKGVGWGREGKGREGEMVELEGDYSRKKCYFFF